MATETLGGTSNGTPEVLHRFLAPLDEAQEGDGRGDGAFGTLDFSEFGQDFLAGVAVGMGHFIGAAGAHGEQDVVDVDSFQRTGGCVGSVADDFGQDMGVEKDLQNLLGQPGRDSQLGGDFRNFGGVPAVLKSPANGGHQAQGENFPVARGDVLDHFFLQINFAVLEGVSGLGAKQHDGPGQIEPGHKNGDEAHAAVHPAVADDARDVKESEEVVQMPDGPGGDAPGQGRPELDFGVRHELIEQRKDEPNEGEGDQLKQKVPDDRCFFNDRAGGLEMGAAGQADPDGDQQRTEGNRDPKSSNAHQPVAPAFNTPDVIEGALDAVEHGDGDEEKKRDTGHAQSAGASVANEFVDALGHHALDGHAGVGGLGRGRYGVGRDGSGVGFSMGMRRHGHEGFIGQACLHGGGRHDMGNKPVDGLVNVVFAFLFEETARDANRNGQQWNHGQQRGVGQRGCADEAAVLDKTPDRESPKMGEMFEPGRLAAGAHQFLIKARASRDFKEALERWFGHERNDNTAGKRRPEGRRCGLSLDFQPVAAQAFTAIQMPSTGEQTTLRYDTIAATPRGIAETHRNKIVIFVPAGEINRITLKFGRSDHRPALSMSIGILLALVGVWGLIGCFNPAKENRYYLGLVALGIFGGSIIFDTLKKRYFLEVDKKGDLCRLVFSKKAKKSEIDEFCNKVRTKYKYEITDDVRESVG